MILYLITNGRYRTWRMFFRGARCAYGLFRLEGNGLIRSVKKTTVLMLAGRGQRIKPQFWS